MVLLALSTPAAVRAQGSMTEAAVLAQWLARSGEVAALRARVREARFDVITSSLWPNPSLQLSVMGTPLGSPPDGVINLGAQWTQPLPALGRVGARRVAAVAALSCAEVEVATTLWELAAELQRLMVARAYAGARAELITRNLAELDRIATIIQQRVAAGANSPYDGLRAQAARATLGAALDNAEIERDHLEARLLAALGDAGIESLPITREDLAAFRGPDDEDALLSLAMLRRPDLELARRGVAAGRAGAARWRAENRWSPSVWLGLYGTHDAASLSVSGGLSFPLPVFDRNQGLIGRAETEAEAEARRAEALTARIEREVRGAFRARARARAALSAFRSQGLSACEALLRRAEVTYQTSGPGGGFSVQDLFDAYRTLWEARTQELDLQRSLAEAEAALERAAALVVP